MLDYDVVIVGAGVVGAAIARELSRYELCVCVLEKEEDVCAGTSKANSGIVHAGYDAVPGSWKARMNARGSALMPELAEKLDFPYRKNGSLVLCFSEEDEPRLEALYERGLKNGVKDLRIISGDEVRAMEPNLSEEVVAALYAPTGAIVCPFGLTIALAENAAANGVEFRFLTAVEKIEKMSGGYAVTTDRGTVTAKYIVNAAGVRADILHNMVSSRRLCITPRRGEYVLMDREAGDTVSRTIFQLPGEKGKGVLVTPTVHGNIMAGPNAEDIDDADGLNTTAAGTAYVRRMALRSVPTLPVGKTITGFAGLRAHEADGDFVLGECEDAPGFFDAAGIESPGLTSAPAIGEYIAGLIAEKAGAAGKKDFIAERSRIPEVAKLPPAERSALIAARPDYGVIVCRCENISEGEIVDAIRRPLGARSLDGVKRRVRQGMGRCQAGFCTPAALEILARELEIPVEAVCKNRPGSEMIKGGGE